MYLSLGLCIAVSMKTTGILFVFSSMLIPPMVGLVLCRRVWAVFVAAVVASLAAGFLGLWASFVWDFPTGPAIVCVQGLLFLLAAMARVFR
jgi:ABC-type Mn2+/Zn2+ transport system permease subunit